MTETPRTPDHLNDLDRPVYDLAVQTMPLAEIAVRLGVSIRQADEKVQRILERVGVPDRESLRAAAARGFAPEEPEPEATDEPTDPEPDRSRASLSRRRLLIGGASLAVLAGGMTAGWRISGQGTPTTPTAAPTGLPSGELFVASPTPSPGRLPVDEEPVRFEVWSFRESDPIDWQHGLFKVYPGSRKIDGFRFRAWPDDPEGFASAFNGYSVGLGGRLVSAVNGVTMRGYLADVSFAKSSWSWPIENLRLVTTFNTVGGDGYALFEHVTGPGWRGAGQFTVVWLVAGSETLDHVADFVLSGSTLGYPALCDTSGRAAIWATNANNELSLNEVDLAKGVVTNSVAIPTSYQGFTDPAPGPLQRFGDGHLLAKWSYRRPNDERQILGAAFPWRSASGWEPGHARSIEWGGSLDTGGRIVEEFPQRFVAIEDSDGGRDYWPELRVRDFSSADPDFRLLSAAISYGDNFPQNRWLADGSGFVAMVRGPETDGSNLDAFEYAVISADGRTVSRIPLPPSGGESRWWNQNAMRGAVPSPYNPNLISFGRTDLYYVTPGAWLRPTVTSEAGPDHIDPWAAGPEFMVFALPHGGHGGASPPVLLNLKREDAPAFSRHFVFVVAGTGDGLRLRAQPSLDGEILANLPDGTEVALYEDPLRPEGLRAVDRADGILWIRVKTGEGEHGWVSSTYLAWP